MKSYGVASTETSYQVADTSTWSYLFTLQYVVLTFWVDEFLLYDNLRLRNQM